MASSGCWSKAAELIAGRQGRQALTRSVNDPGAGVKDSTGVASHPVLASPKDGTAADVCGYTTLAPSTRLARGAGAVGVVLPK